MTPAVSAVLRGSLLKDPRRLPGIEAWYDVSDLSSLTYDSSNRVSLVADKSGKSSVNCLCCDGTSSNSASVPDAAAISITGAIDIAVRVGCPAWQSATTKMLLAKDASGQRSYAFYSNSGNPGKLIFGWSSDGSAFNTSVSTVAVPFANYEAGWVRVTFDTATGTATFYTAQDSSSAPSSWTQLGSTVVTGATSIYDSTTALRVGNDGWNSNCVGNFFRAIVKSGIGGSTVLDANFTTATKLATSFTESSANAATVTINTSGATGARICGERDLYQGTVANQPVLLRHTGENYGYLNGVSGNYFSAPDSAALSITGDIDLRARVALSAITPAADAGLVTKWGAGGQRSWLWYVNTGGNMVLQWSADGTASVTATSTATLASAGIASYTPYHLRATLDVNNGASGYDAKFWYSSDGSNWSQLGATVTGGATTSIFDSTAAVGVGGRAVDGAVNPIGQIYRAQIYNGIAGTLAFDFNASAYVSGTTLLDQSSNGATITLNGGAAIVTRSCLYFDGSNDSLKAAPFTYSEPETLFWVGSVVSWVAGAYLLSGIASGSRELLMVTSTPRIRPFTPGSYGAILDTFSVGVRGLLSSVYAGASSSLRRNRDAPVAGALNAAVADGLTLGAAVAGGNNGNITASEIAIYSQAHSTSILDRFWSYAQRKWGLAP
jgi:hypothetical protein